MLKRPLFFVFLALCAGIWIAGLFHIPFLFEEVTPANHIKNFTPEEPIDIYLGAIIVTDPVSRPVEYDRIKTTFTAKAAALYDVGGGHARGFAARRAWPLRNVCGLVNVMSFDDRDIDLRYGDYVLIKGALSRPRSLHNPGSFSYSDYLARQGIYSVVTVAKGDFISVLAAGRADNFIRRIFDFKRKLKVLIEKNLQPLEGDILKGVLLGDRSGIENDLKDRFVKTGTVHILAISGLHVGLIAAILILVLNFLYVPRYLVYPAASILLILYAVLTGANAPVVRATIMAAALLIGTAFKRKVDILNCLGLAGVIILLKNPSSLFDAGFELSFGTVISIIIFAPKFEALFNTDLNQHWLKRYLKRSIAVSLSAWAGIIPIIAYHFNIISPICILANVPVIFLLFMAVTAGLIFLSAGLLAPFLVSIFAAADEFLIAILVKTVKIFSSVPFGFFWTHRWTAFEIVSFYIALAAFGLTLYKKEFSKSYLAMATLFFLNIMVWQSITPNVTHKLQITVLDVGHGDAIFLEFPEGGSALIDTGEKTPDIDMGEAVLGPYLRSKRIGALDAVFITHNDNDHIGGLGFLLKNFKVRKIFDCDNLKFSDKITGFKDVDILILNPPQQHYSGVEAERNNNSLVLKISYKGRSALFCADIREFAMQKLLAYPSLIKSDCIKIPHHGSGVGLAGESFIKAVSPEFALLSVSGKDVSQPLLKVLQEAGCKIYKTYSDGAVTVTISEYEISADRYHSNPRG